MGRMAIKGEYIGILCGHTMIRDTIEQGRMSMKNINKVSGVF